jgi:alpha-tubulin suppressor-like RCC1 family protein
MRHTVVVKPDGTVWTWGGNGNGQLGDGTTTNRSVPAQVPNINDAIAVAAGSLHTLVLRSDGSVWSWGYNWYGQLGDGTTTQRTDPVLVLGLSNVIAIAAGDNHSVALASDGRVWTWGRNTNGQLGDGSTSGATQPILVTTLTSITAVGAGWDHTLAVKNDGTAWAWGLNTNGQLGDASTTQRTSPVQMTGVTGATAVAAGSTHSLILKSDGTLRACGNNFYGQIGDGTNTQRTSTVAVNVLTNVVSIAAGQLSSYARKSDGTVWGWGANGSGQLGDGTTTGRNTPTQASSLSGIGLLGAGQEHALGVTTTGVVWSWGANAWGQIGDGTTVGRPTPVAISDVDYAWKVGTPVFSVAAGTYTTEKTVIVTCVTPGAAIHYTLNGDTPTESDAVVASGGSILIDQTRTLKARAWKTGMPASSATTAVYTLAVSSLQFSPTPTTYTSAQTVTISTTSPGASIHFTVDGSTPSEASTLYTGPLSVSTSTTIKAIGLRSNWTSSAVATGTYTMNFGTLAAPTFDPGTASYTTSANVSISAMAGATIRYTTNGSAVTTSSPIYTSAIEVTTTTTINAKAYHQDYTTSPQSSATYTIVVASPTLSHTSGTYPAGQVITASTSTPGATLTFTTNGVAPTSNGAVFPSAGIVAGNYTLKVAAWKTGATPSAVVTASYEVTGTLTTARVSGGGSHSLAVRTDGVSFGWGANASGQVGDGTTTNRSLPVVVNAASGVVAISAGEIHSLAALSNGSVLAWGNNQNGRLGDGTTTNRSLPTPVPGLSTVVTVSAASSHSVALKSGGTVWAWGYNASGQLGNGNTTQQLSPVQASGLTGITAIAAAGSSSFALGGDGVVWSWGANGNGQLGTGNTTGRSTPGTITGLSSVTAVSTSGSHTIALLSDGTVKAWGWNLYGQVGDGSTTQRTSPVTVTGLTTVVAIAAGGTHSLALLADGTVRAWGYNGDGRLGDGTTTNQTTSVAVTGLPTIVSIAAGATHSLAVAADGSVWAWGRNADRQLGDGTTTNRTTPVQIANAGMVWKIPTPVLSLASGLYSIEQTVTVTSGDPDATLHYTTNGTNPTQSDPTVASGGSVAVSQSLTLKVRAWKPGAVASEIAIGAYELKAVTPTFSPGTGQYGSSQNVVISTTTSSATLRYTTDGTEPTVASTVYTGAAAVPDTRTLKAKAFRSGWTTSDSGASSYVIYVGTVATPTILPVAGTFTVTPLVTLACATAGTTIRYTTDGSDPHGGSEPYQFPFLITRTATVKARAFLAGFQPSAVASAAYSLDAAGQTAPPTIVPAGGTFAVQQTITITGPAGSVVRYTTTGVDPTETDATVPGGGTITVDRAQIIKARAWLAGSPPSVVQRADFVVTGALAAGHQHSLGLAADGTLWTWGRGTDGQIGDGGMQDRSVPVSVLTNVTAVAGGQQHSVAVRNDGTVWGFGSNGSGRLGDGTTTPRPLPTQALGLTDIVAVAAGYDHTLALKSDGTVWAFGSNADGQLGDGTNTASSTAVQVLGLDGVTSIAAGDRFSLAVQQDGATGGFVWAWGRNSSGQLGDGSTLARSIPVRVPGIANAVQVAAGESFGLVRLTDGTVRGWGANDATQLGTMLGASSTIPVVVPALSGVTFVTAGSRHALALDADGRIWGWGLNANGQLGTPNYNGTPGTGAPQLLPGVVGALGAAGGRQHSIVLRADGSVWGTGSLLAAGLGPGSYTALAQIPSFTLAPNAWLLTDGDGDGLPAWREYLAAVDPLASDTNGNGLSDLVDVRRQSQTGNPDDDADGVPNAIERANGTDPFLADTDGDTVSDLLDDYPLDPTRTQKPAPNPSDTTPPTINLIYPATARPVGGD